MDYKNIELTDKATGTLKDMLKFQNDNMSLYTLKLIETLEKTISVTRCSTQLKTEKELIDCVHNLMGFFDTPIAKMKMPSQDCEEVRSIARKVLKKHNVNHRGF
jgi:hypothetical protein